MNTFFKILKTPLGPLLITSDEDAILSVQFHKETPGNRKWMSQMKPAPKSLQVLKDAEKQLNQYFAGKRKSFDLPVKLVGTSFQLKSWTALAEIPYGQTISYQQQAKFIKKPKAVRAIGMANGQNPICIILPCHRVIGKSGKLTGYASGVDKKEFLLKLEQAI